MSLGDLQEIRNYPHHYLAGHFDHSFIRTDAWPWRKMTAGLRFDVQSHNREAAISHHKDLWAIASEFTFFKGGFAQASNEHNFPLLQFRSKPSHVLQYRQAPISEQMPKQQNIVGPVIRALREKRQITQDQLVAKLNLAGWDVSRATLSKIEAQIRCVTDYELPILAISVGVEPWDLIKTALAKSARKG